MRKLLAGSHGDDVKALQQFLAQDPAIYPEGKITKTYGPATTRAVQRFQNKYKIVAEGQLGFGIVGPKTCQVINRLSAAVH
jgi:peptidoglycan hydrolase-like protein with peptidoglycan-binding domain